MLYRRIDLALLASCVFFAQLVLIWLAGSEIPFWDQWDAEADTLLKPWLESRLDFAQLVDSHNEHRILLTRLSTLLVFEVVGYWNPLAEMIFNAGVYALSAVAVFHYLSVATKTPWIVFALVAVFWMAPFGAENTLGGFQSQFFFMILFTVSGMYCVIQYPWGSPRWILGWVLLLLNLFTITSGVIASSILIFLYLLRFFFTSDGIKKIAPNLLMALFVTLLGAVMYVSIPQHESIKAQSLGQLVVSTAQAMAWPWVGQPWMVIVLYSPVALFFVYSLIKRQMASSGTFLLLALGGWCTAQCLVLGYGRGNVPGIPASRYMDILQISYVVNFCVMLHVLKLIDLKTSKKVVTVLAFLAVGLGGMLVLLHDHSLPYIMAKRQSSEAQRANIQNYYSTKDLEWMRGLAREQIPYPSADRLVQLLEDPTIAKILPNSIKPGLPSKWTGTGDESRGFVSNGYYPLFSKPNGASLGSYGDSGDATQGRWGTGEIETSSKFLSLKYMGKPNGEGMLLGLEAEGVLTPLPVSEYTDNWTEVLVKLPPKKFKLVAKDESDKYWLALSEIKFINAATRVVDGILEYSFLGLLISLFCVLSRILWMPLRDSLSA